MFSFIVFQEAGLRHFLDAILSQSMNIGNFSWRELDNRMLNLRYFEILVIRSMHIGYLANNDLIF